MIITELRHTTKSVTRHQAICGFDDMSRCNADRHVHSDGTVPYYWRLVGLLPRFWCVWYDDPGHAGLCPRAVGGECYHRRPGGDDRVSGHHDLPPGLGT